MLFRSPFQHRCKIHPCPLRPPRTAIMAGASATYRAVVGPTEEVTRMADFADFVEFAGYSFVGAGPAGDYYDDWGVGLDGDDCSIGGGGHVCGGGDEGEEGGEEGLDGIMEYLVITLFGFLFIIMVVRLRS